MLKDFLKKSGFSEKETEVYLALLDLGAAVVSGIAKKAKINRSTTYVILDSLTEKGLVNTTGRRGVKVYSPMPAEQFVKRLEGMAKQYSELASAAKKVLPKVKPKALEETGLRPRVRLYEGSEGMKTVYEDALTSLETIRAYAFSKEGAQPMPEQYFNQLAKKKIKVHALFPETSQAKELATGGKRAYDFSPDISVYDNKITFVSPEEEFALIIESQELADALKKAFDLSWKEARREGKLSLAGGSA